MSEQKKKLVAYHEARKGFVSAGPQTVEIKACPKCELPFG